MRVSISPRRNYSIQQNVLSGLPYIWTSIAAPKRKQINKLSNINWLSIRYASSVTEGCRIYSLLWNWSFYWNFILYPHTPSSDDCNDIGTMSGTRGLFYESVIRTVWIIKKNTGICLKWEPITKDLIIEVNIIVEVQFSGWYKHYSLRIIIWSMQNSNNMSGTMFLPNRIYLYAVLFVWVNSKWCTR
jgi:hypothetical protein